MQKLWLPIALLGFASSAAMFAIGSSNSHLTELVDFFWVPLPLATMSLILALKKKS